MGYDDAQTFIRWLNEKTSGNYRLPTEAEWKYAARADTTTAYSWRGSAWRGSGSRAGAYAWYYYKLGGSTRAHAAGGKQPNPWGLYDMHGNAAEWVSDRYDEDYYKNSPARDSQGPGSGSYRLLRGGSWLYYATHLRSAYRGYYSPGNRGSSLGFRLVRTP